MATNPVPAAFLAHFLGHAKRCGMWRVGRLRPARPARLAEEAPRIVASGRRRGALQDEGRPRVTAEHGAIRPFCHARHCSSPCMKTSRGRSTPMKTILLDFFSPGPQAGPRSLPMSWCTPWKTTLRGVPFM